MKFILKNAIDKQRVNDIKKEITDWKQAIQEVETAISHIKKADKISFKYPGADIENPSNYARGLEKCIKDIQRTISDLNGDLKYFSK